MKKKLVLGSFFLAVFVIGIIGGMIFPKIIFSWKPVKKTAQTNPADEKPHVHNVRNNSFVVLITAYNVLPWCEATLKSVFEQNYLNYRVIYIDDHSSDGSYAKIQELIEKNHWKDHITLIRNDIRKGAGANVYRVIHQYCRDDEIVILLDGDDRVAHPAVLKRLNDVYSDPEIWMSYSDYIEYPSFRPGVSGPLDYDLLNKGEIRKHQWVCSHLKTFYAGLYKKLRIEDFVFQGEFVYMRWDWIAMFGMIEMARQHYAYIPEVFLIHTCFNPLRHERVNMSLYVMMSHYARSLPSYPPLQELFIHPKTEAVKEKVEAIIFSFDRCMQLRACLESMRSYAKGDVHTTVIYLSTNEQFSKGYEELKLEFPEVSFVYQPTRAKEDFKLTLLKVLLEQTKNRNYVFFGVDSTLFKSSFNINDAVSMMEKTQAYCFFLCLGADKTIKKSQKLIELWDHTYAWPIVWSESIWSLPHNLEMTILRKQDVIKMLKEIEFLNPNSLRKVWGVKPVENQKAMALCFDEPKSIHVSGVRNHTFLSTYDYQDLFGRGMKIDITPFHDIKNDSHHMECEIKFVPK